MYECGGKKKAEEEGNGLVSIKSKMIKGAGDALKSDGKEAIASASEGIGEVVKGANQVLIKVLLEQNICRFYF